MSKKELTNENDYNSLLVQSVSIIEKARTQIAVQLNSATSQTYFEIGRILNERKLESKHGSAVVERLSADLKERYPKMGFSTRQLWNMKKFYERYANSDLKLLQAVAVLPWSDNLLLLNKGLDDTSTLYYAQETIAKNWTRELLLNAIKMKMHERQLSVDNNFSLTLPTEQSNYAVAIDLKIGEFKPEYVGKMNYYLSLLDEKERGKDEDSSIGIILCAEKDHVEVQLALKDVNKPIGVADYQLMIPTEELQKVISDEIKLFEMEQTKLENL